MKKVICICFVFIAINVFSFSEPLVWNSGAFIKIAPSIGPMGIFVPIVNMHTNLHFLLEPIPNLYVGGFLGFGLLMMYTGVIGLEITYDIAPFLNLNCNIAYLSLNSDMGGDRAVFDTRVTINPGITWLVFRWGEPDKEYNGVFISINKGFELYKNEWRDNLSTILDDWYLINIEIGYFVKDL